MRPFLHTSALLVVLFLRHPVTAVEKKPKEQPKTAGIGVLTFVGNRDPLSREIRCAINSGSKNGIRFGDKFEVHSSNPRLGGVIDGELTITRVTEDESIGTWIGTGVIRKNDIVKRNTVDEMIERLDVARQRFRSIEPYFEGTHQIQKDLNVSHGSLKLFKNTGEKRNLDLGFERGVPALEKYNDLNEQYKHFVNKRFVHVTNTSDWELDLEVSYWIEPDGLKVSDATWHLQPKSGGFLKIDQRAICAEEIHYSIVSKKGRESDSLFAEDGRMQAIYILPEDVPGWKEHQIKVAEERRRKLEIENMIAVERRHAALEQMEQEKRRRRQAMIDNAVDASVLIGKGVKLFGKWVNSGTPSSSSGYNAAVHGHMETKMLVCSSCQGRGKTGIFPVTKCGTCNGAKFVNKRQWVKD